MRVSKLFSKKTSNHATASSVAAEANDESSDLLGPLTAPPSRRQSGAQQLSRAQLESLNESVAKTLGMSHPSLSAIGEVEKYVTTKTDPRAVDRPSRLVKIKQHKPRGSMVSRRSSARRSSIVADESDEAALRRSNSIVKIAKFWRIDLEAAAELCRNFQSAQQRSSVARQSSTGIRRSSSGRSSRRSSVGKSTARRGSSIVNIARRWRITEEEAEELALTFESAQGAKGSMETTPVNPSGADEDEVWGTPSTLFESINFRMPVAHPAAC